MDSKCKFLSVFQGSAVSDSYSIVINTDGSVEVQARYVSFIKKVSGTGMIDLPMAIEEVHTFKIEKGQDVYKTTDAKITVYKLESTSIQLTEENLKDQEVLSQVRYNRDEDNDENNKKA